MLAEVSLGANSTSWKAIEDDGDLVDPGSANTLHYDWISSKITMTKAASTFTTDEGKGCGYKDFALSGLDAAPELAKALILYPDASGDVYGGDYRYVNLTGERLPICGGNWYYGGVAGVFDVNLSNPRSGAYADIGFRSAYCDL